MVVAVAGRRDSILQRQCRIPGFLDADLERLAAQRRSLRGHERDCVAISARQRQRLRECPVVLDQGDLGEVGRRRGIVLGEWAAVACDPGEAVGGGALRERPTARRHAWRSNDVGRGGQGRQIEIAIDDGAEHRPAFQRFDSQISPVMPAMGLAIAAGPAAKRRQYPEKKFTRHRSLLQTECGRERPSASGQDARTARRSRRRR